MVEELPPATSSLDGHAVNNCPSKTHQNPHATYQCYKLKFRCYKLNQNPKTLHVKSSN